jgi:glycosyltransferase involved in cell wall biosynthesis
MKILQITPYYLPHTGGLEQYVFNLSTYLVKQGHQVDVLTSDIPVGSKNEESNGIFITRLKSYGEPLRNPIIPDIFFLKDLNNYDVINLHTIYGFSSIVAWVKNNQIKTPMVLTHHGKLQFGSYFRDIVVNVYECSIAKKILNTIDCSIALTSSDAHFLSTLGVEKERIRIIPNGIDTSEFEPFYNLDPLVIRESLGLKNKFILLYVGVITHRKGIKYLIRAMSEIRNKFSPEEIVLLIIGSGPDVKSIKELIKGMNLEKYIFVKGKVSHQELMHYYRAASLFVLPSISEGMPTVILEAFYFDLPVITTDIPALRDSFKDMAILVPPKNDKALADAIITLYKDSEMADRLSSMGKEKVVNTYSWEKIVHEYEDLYTGLLEHKKNL